MTAVTAVTSQNSKGVFSVIPINAKEIKSQILYTMQDIKPTAIKIECFIPLKSLRPSKTLCEGLKILKLF